MAAELSRPRDAIDVRVQTVEVWGQARQCVLAHSRSKFSTAPACVNIELYRCYSVKMVRNMLITGVNLRMIVNETP